MNFASHSVRQGPNSKLTGAFLASLSAFIFAIIGGSLWGGGGTTCFRFIGCNAGFFGYDGVEHFFFGIFVVVSLVWLAVKFPKFNFFQTGFLRNAVIIISIVVLVGFCWEILEFGHDLFLNRAITFYAIGFLRPSMAQASNGDTMGDLSLDLFGGIIGVATLKLLERDIL